MDGRTFKQQILLSEAGQPGVRADLMRLASALHAAGAKVSIQLTHGGGFADPVHAGGRTVAPSSVFNPAAMVRAVTPRAPQCIMPTQHPARSFTVNLVVRLFSLLHVLTEL